MGELAKQGKGTQRFRGGVGARRGGFTKVQGRDTAISRR